MNQERATGKGLNSLRPAAFGSDSQEIHCLKVKQSTPSRTPRVVSSQHLHLAQAQLRHPEGGLQSMTGTPSTTTPAPQPLASPIRLLSADLPVPMSHINGIAYSVATCICLLSTEWHVFYSFLSLTFSFEENVKFRGRSQESHTGLARKIRVVSISPRMKEPALQPAARPLSPEFSSTLTTSTPVEAAGPLFPRRPLHLG